MDMHGTTHSRLSLEKENWKAYAVKFPQVGQWTRVMTMPHAVVASVKRDAEVELVDTRAKRMMLDN